MKELSIEEKAKAYDEAVEKLRDFYRDYDTVSLIDVKEELEPIFPELKESEDERIRKALIDYFDDANKADENPLQSYGVHTDKAIAWLEKQKEQKEDVTKDKIAEYLKKLILDQSQRGAHMLDYEGRIEEEVDFIISIAKKELKKVEQKSADKVKSKFEIKEGKWYICIKDLLDSYANKAFHKGDTYLSTQDGSLMPSNSNVPFEVVCPDAYFRDWTIQDAKDGDVLADGNDIVIFKENNYNPKDKSGCMFVYCSCNNFYEFGGINPTFYTPATKEQRNTLIKAMVDAGYAFDSEKKELKKIEEYDGENYGVDSLWHARHILKKTLGKVDGYQSDDGILEHKCAISVVDRLYKNKLAWSAEDTFKVQSICKHLDEAKKYCADIAEVIECGNWLKAIKDRYAWKPSKEQMQQLGWIAEQNKDNIIGKELMSLYRDLKKLREE